MADILSQSLLVLLLGAIFLWVERRLWVYEKGLCLAGYGSCRLRPAWRWGRLLCLLLALLLLPVAAYCLPKALGEKETRPPLLFWVLDCSPSMQAQDANGTRLEGAKTWIRAVTAACPNAELALCSFSGQAMLDFLPSTEKIAFAAALAAVTSDKQILGVGSNPAAALRLAENSLSPEEAARACLILLSDGEINLPPSRPPDDYWRQRQLPCLFIGIGQAGLPALIPDGDNWLLDPESGMAATSNADFSGLQQQLRQAATPSAFLSGEGNFAEALSILQRFGFGAHHSIVTENGAASLLPSLLLLAAALLLLLGLWYADFILLLGRFPRLGRCRALLLFISVGLLAWATLAYSGEIETGNKKMGTANHVEELEEQLRLPGLRPAPRCLLLVQLARRYCQQAVTTPESPANAKNLQNAIALCREALRLQPGDHSAAITLEYALHLQQKEQKKQTPKTETPLQIKKAGKLPEQSPKRSDNNEHNDNKIKPENARAGKLPSGEPEKIIPKTEKDSTSRSAPEARLRTWRELQQRQERHRPGQSDSKPW